MDVIKDIQNFIKVQSENRGVFGEELDITISECRLYIIELQYLLDETNPDREHMTLYIQTIYQLKNILGRAENILSNYKEMNNEDGQRLQFVLS